MYAVAFHAHQKIDKIAYKQLSKLADGRLQFPSVKTILGFEGPQGPDSAKLKNDPKIKEPWHFIDPFDKDDIVLCRIIEQHYRRLVAALRATDSVRAAFEASWIAHAIVDGLTPAHHYPYESELRTIRGADYDNRTSAFRRLTVHGENLYESILKSLRLVGPKGLLSTHTSFEGGAYIMLKLLRRRRSQPSYTAVEAIRGQGVATYFRQQVRDIAELKLYERFYRHGWTPRLARHVNRHMLPRMVDTVALTWYSAMLDAFEPLEGTGFKGQAAGSKA